MTLREEIISILTSGGMSALSDELAAHRADQIMSIPFGNATLADLWDKGPGMVRELQYILQYSGDDAAVLACEQALTLKSGALMEAGE